MTSPDGISRKQMPAAPRSARPEDALGAIRPAVAGGAGTGAEHTARQSESAERRGLLSIALRDAMSAAGLLPADYKIKAWSADRSGGAFLVIVDVAGHFGGDAPHSLASLEALMVGAANTRFDITVTGVYWRMDLQKALLPAHRTAAGKETPLPPAAVHSPALDALTAVDLSPVSKQPLASRMREIFAPIEADDVAAFRRAKARAAGDRDVGAADETDT